MVTKFISPFSLVTLVIAPSTALDPQEIFTPSKAGPAAVEAVRICVPSVIITSPFVPRSIAAMGPPGLSNPKYARQARASEPTNPPIKAGRETWTFSGKIPSM